MTESLIGVGVYSISEVHRLTAISKSVVGRFVKKYKGRGGLWGGKEQNLGNFHYLTFMDLVELRIINAFHVKGVSWQKICRTAEYAQERFETDYPFSHKRFKMDGEHIYNAALRSLEDVSMGGQMAFHKIMSPALFDPLEYDGDVPMRWYPMSGTKAVMIDGRYSFGAPVLTKHGVPTGILYKSYMAEKRNIPFVASIYAVSPEGVKDAVKYEKSLLERLAA